MNRVYLPASPTLVRRWLADRSVPAGAEGFAVTPGVEVALEGGDQEELEYAAMVAAAEASIGLLDDDAPPRRMVLAVDADVETVDDTAGEVRLAGAVAWVRVAALHVDAAAAEPDVRAARGGLTDEVGERLDRHELEWFAAQEIPGVVGGDG